MEHAKETVGAFCLGLLPHSFTCWRTLEVVVYLCTCLAAKFRSFFCSPLPYSRQQLDSICGCVLFLFSKSLAQTNGGMGMATQIGKWNQDSRQTTTQYLLMIKRNSLRILLTINVLIKLTSNVYEFILLRQPETRELIYRPSIYLHDCLISTACTCGIVNFLKVCSN